MGDRAVSRAEGAKAREPRNTGGLSSRREQGGWDEGTGRHRGPRERGGEGELTRGLVEEYGGRLIVSHEGEPG